MMTKNEIYLANLLRLRYLNYVDIKRKTEIHGEY